MTAYYNEIDIFAAEWLRNLIKAGLIAPGDVDTRSIADVRPDDLRPYTQCHFFAGLGAWSWALRRAGWLDDSAVWTGSCPCQPFSAAGRQAGADDPRHLWPEWFRLIRECRPPVVIGEQVAAAIRHGWLDLVQGDLEGEGYACGSAVLGAHSVGAPHIRQRLWFVAHPDSERSLQHAQLWKKPGNHSEIAWSCEAGIVAHSPLDGWREERPDAGGVAGGFAAGDRAEGRAAGPESSGVPGELGNASCLGREGWESLQGGPGERRIDAGAGATCKLGYSIDTGLEGHAGYGSGSEGWSGPVGSTAEASELIDPRPTNGFWRDADWLFCRDGKWRPVMPGTFPLVVGATSRVGRLRAYGNAIVAPVAEAFIRAYMETQAR